MSQTAVALKDSSNATHGFAGHPKGLSTLFFTEMWERFSYYGMRAILILFMVAPKEKGGFGLSAAEAAWVYGWYTSLVWFSAVPGGWLNDHYLGAKRGVFIGGMAICLGHFSMAFSNPTMFYLGLGMIIIGTGFLKPGATSLVGSLYGKGDHRRDAGFSIYYMGINLGATFGPILVGYLGQKVGWHWGFSAAGIFMAAGLVQYAISSRSLPDAGGVQSQSTFPKLPMVTQELVFLAITLSACGLLFAPASFIGTLKVWLPLIAALGGLVFIWMRLKRQISADEMKKVWAMVGLFFFAAIFWGAFEQAGSSLNLFADQYTRNTLFGWDFPSSFFQSVQPGSLILFAPVFAWLWVRLGQRNPSSPTKFVVALLFVGASFLLLAWASHLSGPEKALVSPLWLTLVYLLHSFGELCLSPVFMSMVTKLAPARYVGSMLGIYYLSISAGNKMGAWVAGYFETFPLPQLFGSVFLTTFVAAAILAILTKKICNLMGGKY